MVRLVPEPNNPFDPNAVAVLTEGNATIGYLSRDVAKGYQKRLLGLPTPITCPAQLRGGNDGESIDVVLDFENVQTIKR